MDRREILEKIVMTLGGGLISLPEKQSAQIAPRGRRPVVPQQVIEEYRLQPTEGYGLWVMGEDGRPYALDDVLLVLFSIVRSHWGGDQNQQRALPKMKRP